MFCGRVGSELAVASALLSDEDSIVLASHHGRACTMMPVCSCQVPPSSVPRVRGRRGSSLIVEFCR